MRIIMTSKTQNFISFWTDCLDSLIEQVYDVNKTQYHAHFSKMINNIKIMVIYTQTLLYVQ